MTTSHIDSQDTEDLERTPTTKGSGWNPDEPSDPNHHRWSGADYRAASVLGAGAEKLASSAVAPLVAFARGYQTLAEGNFKEIVTSTGIKSNSKQYSLIHEASVTPAGSSIEPRDALVMPWFTAAAIYNDSIEKSELKPTTMQFRPSHPYSNEKTGKVLKYVFAKGADMINDIHPSTPRDWINDTTIPVLMAEGLLKGDSALTGWLLSFDHITPSDLAVPDDVLTVGQAREALERILESVPAHQRLLITRTPSATTFLKDPEFWLRLDFSSREVWIGMDADIAGNTLVWQAGHKLAQDLAHRRRAASVKVLSPQVADADGEDAKAGIDDFLYEHTWDELVSNHLTDTFPDKPEDDTSDFSVGDWRMAKNNTCTEELYIPKEDDGSGSMTNGNPIWRPTGMMIGGRQIAREVYRTPTDSEMADGKVDHGHNIASETMVSVEVAWMNGDDRQTAIITGPLDILSDPPEKWLGKGAEIPAEVQELRQWPPRGEKGVKWLEAMKATRRADVQSAVCWTRMGWVPVQSKLPSFLVGRTTIAEDDEALSAVKVGFDADVLPHFESFGIGGWGVNLPDPDFKDPIFLRQVLADVTRLMDLYIHSGAWTDRRVAATVLLTGIRPVFPARPKSTLFIMGEKGRGKSMTARYIMAFWANDRTSWVEALPGSANDTEASIENAMGHAPIWVLDDLAPSTNGRQAQLQEAKIENVIRAQFNAAGRGRMKADMTTRRSSAPMAQLIITAENEISTPSARERMVPIEIGKGALSSDTAPTEAIRDQLQADGLQPRVISHLVRYLLFAARADQDSENVSRWQKIRDELLLQNDTLKREIIENMAADGLPKSETERASTLAADLSAGAHIMHHMIAHVISELGLAPGEYDPALATWFTDVDGGGPDLVRQVVQTAHKRGKALSPGRSLLKAVQEMLKAGVAHIDNGEEPDVPPMVASKAEFSMELTEKRVNTLLGWTISADDSRPNGPTIGTLVSVKDKLFVLLNKEMAFKEAQRHHSNLVLPGQKSRQAWLSLDSEGFWPEDLSRSDRISYRHRQTNSTGFPVSLETLLSYDPDEETSTERA